MPNYCNGVSASAISDSQPLIAQLVNSGCVLTKYSPELLQLLVVALFKYGTNRVSSCRHGQRSDAEAKVERRIQKCTFAIRHWCFIVSFVLFG